MSFGCHVGSELYSGTSLCVSGRPIEGKSVSSLQLLQLSFTLSGPGVVQHCWICITAAEQSHWTALQHRAGGNH